MDRNVPHVRGADKPADRTDISMMVCYLRFCHTGPQLRPMLVFQAALTLVAAMLLGLEEHLVTLELPGLARRAPSASSISIRFQSKSHVSSRINGLLALMTTMTHPKCMGLRSAMNWCLPQLTEIGSLVSVTFASLLRIFRGSNAPSVRILSHRRRTGSKITSRTWLGV
jgi:hypothetical protein